jgi:hypothetical protein
MGDGGAGPCSRKREHETEKGGDMFVIFSMLVIGLVIAFIAVAVALGVGFFVVVSVVVMLGAMMGVALALAIGGQRSRWRIKEPDA